MRYRTVARPKRISRTITALLVGVCTAGLAVPIGLSPADAAVRKPTAAAAQAKAAAAVRAAAQGKAAAASRAADRAALAAAALRTIPVSSAAALFAALTVAQPGDRIELASGSYQLRDTLKVEASGTAAAPIVIAAAAGSTPEIRGKGGVEIRGGYVTVEGLTFLNSDTVKVTPTAVHARITSNTFRLAMAATNWLSVAGDDTEVDHNQFVGKRSAGVFLQIIGAGASDMAERVRVDHNYFADHNFRGTNGGEALRLGISARQHANAKAVIEDNLFERVNGDQEAISVKSSGNIIRRNTIRASKGTITLRHGAGNLVDSNLLIGGTTGIRVFGNDQTVINNIVQDSTRNRTVEVGGGDRRDDVLAGDDHDAADRVLIAFNTIVSTAKESTALQVGDAADLVAPDSVTIADNILVGAKRAVRAERGSRLIWVGNLGAGAVAGVFTGFQAADAKLVRDPGGVFRPGTGSAATGAAIGTWNEVTLDVDGQARPDQRRTVGADEPNAGAAANCAPATKLSLGLD